MMTQFDRTLSRDDVSSALFTVAMELAAGLGFDGLTIRYRDGETVRVPTDAEVTAAASQSITLAAVLADVARVLDVELPPALAAALDERVAPAPDVSAQLAASLPLAA